MSGKTTKANKAKTNQDTTQELQTRTHNTRSQSHNMEDIGTPNPTTTAPVVHATFNSDELKEALAANNDRLIQAITDANTPFFAELTTLLRKLNDKLEPPPPSATLSAGSANTNTFPSQHAPLTFPSFSPLISNSSSSPTLHETQSSSTSPILVTIYLQSSTTKKITTFEAPNEDDEDKPLLTLPSFLHMASEDTIPEQISTFLANQLNIQLPENISYSVFHEDTLTPTSTTKDSTLLDLPRKTFRHMGFHFLHDDIAPQDDSSIKTAPAYFDLTTLQQVQRKESHRLLNSHLDLLEEFAIFEKCNTKAAKDKSKAEERYKRTTRTSKLTDPYLQYIKEDLSCLSHIASLRKIAPTLDQNPHHPRHAWIFPQLTGRSIHQIDPYFHNALAHAQSHRQTPPWDSISPEVKQMILSHSSNRDDEFGPVLFLDNMLNHNNIPKLIHILQDMAKPETPTAFLQAYSQRVQFPDSIITDTNHELQILLANLHIFLSTTYTFWHSYINSRVNEPPMNAKPHGFLDVMYKKMPHLLILIAIVQEPLDPGIKKPDLLDFIWHIQARVNTVIRTHMVHQSALQSALPTPAPVSIPLLQRFPLYNGTTTPRAPSTNSASTQPRTDAKPLPYDPSKQRPEHTKAPYQQRTNTTPYHSQRQQHLQHYQPDDDDDSYSFTSHHQDQEDHLDPTYPPVEPSFLHQDTTFDSDDDFINPEDLTTPPLKHLYSIRPEERRSLSQRHYHHVLTTAPPGTEPSVPACYRMLWNGKCERPNSKSKCTWSHDPSALREAWHFHRNALEESRYAPHNTTARQPHHSTSSPVVLQRPSHHQRQYPPERYSNSKPIPPPPSSPPPPYHQQGYHNNHNRNH